MEAPSILAYCSGVLAKSPISKTVRFLAASALLIGALSISGCLGVSGTANPPVLSPPSISFGSVAVGSKVNQSVTISNNGGSDLTVSQVSVAVPGFTVSGISLPMMIHSGKQTTVDVVFSPKTTGSVSGEIYVVSDAPGSLATMAISGTGVPSTSLLSASSTSVNFGNVSIGGSGSLSVTLTNTGNSSVTISSVNTSNSQIATSGVSGGLILTPGQNAAMNVTFSPLTAGTLTASVTVTSSASNSPLTIALSGSGVQPSSHSVTLSWKGSLSSVAGYNVYRSVSGAAYTKMNSSLIPTSQYTDTTVQAGQTYYYVATSVDSTNQESPYSQQVSVTIPTP
jgi:hypothetical protein